MGIFFNFHVSRFDLFNQLVYGYLFNYFYSSKSTRRFYVRSRRDLKHKVLPSDWRASRDDTVDCRSFHPTGESRVLSMNARPPHRLTRRPAPDRRTRRASSLGASLYIEGSRDYYTTRGWIHASMNEWTLPRILLSLSLTLAVKSDNPYSLLDARGFHSRFFEGVHMHAGRGVPPQPQR